MQAPRSVQACGEDPGRRAILSVEACSEATPVRNNGWRLGADEPFYRYWAPIKNYAPFQELVKLKDGS